MIVNSAWVAIVLAVASVAPILAQTPVPAVRDSAGIRIVENPWPAAVPHWTLSERPVLELGSATGDPDQEFAGIAGAVLLNDGSVAVVDRTPALRVYSAEGRLIHRAGRRGRGPGEFTAPRGLWRLSGDSLLVYDAIGRRLTVFGPGAVYARDFTLEVPSGANGVAPVGVLESGGLIARGLVAFTPQPGRVMRSPAAPVVRYDPEGHMLGTVARIEGSEIWNAPAARAAGASTGVVPDLPFRRTLQIRSVGNRIMTGWNDSYEIRFLSPDGRLLQVVRREYTPVRVTRDDLAAFVERQRLQVAPGLRGDLDRMYRDAPVSRTKPAYGTIVPHAGGIWVEEPGEASAQVATWTVFDSDGRTVATVSAPADIDIVDVNQRRVLAIWKDELEVEHIRLYTLISS